MSLSPIGFDYLDRRNFLAHSATGLSGIALLSLFGQSAIGNEPRVAHFTPKAKQVLVIFCSGACSQLDTWDYKPELIRLHGQPMPGGEKLITFQGEQGALAKSPWEFKARGESGKMISDLLPHLAEFADDLCFIHSMQGKTNTHGPGENYMSTGYTLDGFPSVGGWVTYALGSEDQ